MAGLEANNIPRADTASTFIGSLLYRYIYFWGMYVVASNCHKLKRAFKLPESELPGNLAAQPVCHLASVCCAAPPAPRWRGRGLPPALKSLQSGSAPQLWSISSVGFGAHTDQVQLVSVSREVGKSLKHAAISRISNTLCKNKNTTGPGLFGLDFFFFPRALKTRCSCLNLTVILNI